LPVEGPLTARWAKTKDIRSAFKPEEEVGNKNAETSYVQNVRDT